MQLPVINAQGQETGRHVEIADELIAIDPNTHCIWLDVKHYLAAQRQGTHYAKERSAVSFSTKKIKKQKGTGGARAGSIKSGVFVGGGRIHGPRPRDYSFKLNRKVKQLARRSALAIKAREGKLRVLETPALQGFSAPSTKQFVSMMGALGLGQTKTLMLLNGSNQNVYLSSRNLQRSRVLPVDLVNTYELMHCDTIVLSEDALPGLAGVLA